MDKWRILFFGTPEIATICLARLINDERFSVGLVVTQPDKPAGRGAKPSAPATKILALENSIPVFQPVSLRKEIDESIGTIEKHGPFDIGVVVAFGQILPQIILDLPRRGCVNIHASLLPRWRGAAPIQRAILAGDVATGICLMNMEAGLDTGGVYSRESVPIAIRENAASLHDKLAEAGAKLLINDLASIINEEIKAIPQEADGITYAKKITTQESEINWNQKASEIDRQIRAFSPVPGAYTTLGGKRLKIFSAKPVTLQHTSAAPGKISFVDRSRLEVECLDGVMALEEIQLEGKRRLSIAEFLKGMRVDTSTVLGHDQVLTS